MTCPLPDCSLDRGWGVLIRLPRDPWGLRVAWAGVPFPTPLCWVCCQKIREARDCGGRWALLWCRPDTLPRLGEISGGRAYLVGWGRGGSSARGRGTFMLLGTTGREPVTLWVRDDVILKIACTPSRGRCGSGGGIALFAHSGLVSAGCSKSLHPYSMEIPSLTDYSHMAVEGG